MSSSFLHDIKTKHFPALEMAREPARLALRLFAPFSLGIMAGFFFAFSNPVMMAFQQLEADIFIQAFNGINISVRNGIFFAAFFVPLAALLGAALVDRNNRLLWLSALVIYTVVVIQTCMVNVPINEFFKTISTEIPSNWQELRDRWALSNLVRTMLTTIAFFLALLAAARNSERHAPV
ncbi:MULTISPECIES: anthrone oxygenase family protein [unclassified Rhizobium]|uniref:anthrone oxygenase family protein n=1 Tax=unclassified Rhizobium TaxID=2613769 RepID=UPI00247994AF|nr:MULTISPECIES: anthrone oxygenase family protein [unclassified Rhizobium]MDH7801165.1 putative membrane protein [Rhizobium sp. AN70]